MKRVFTNGYSITVRRLPLRSVFDVAVQVNREKYRALQLDRYCPREWVAITFAELRQLEAVVRNLKFAGWITTAEAALQDKYDQLRPKRNVPVTVEKAEKTDAIL